MKELIHNIKHKLKTNTCDVTVPVERITVLLADANKAVRREYVKILEREGDLEVVGQADNGFQAVAMAKKLRPSLILMAITMPLLNGLDATRQILDAVPATKVLMLSMHSDEEYVKAATNSGAMGYLIKHSSADTVCPAIRAVHNGDTFFSPSIPIHLQKRKGEEKMTLTSR